MNAVPHPDTDQPAEAMVLAERLKSIREYLNYSQQMVSDRTGIPRSAISEIERGSRRVESLELKKLAKLYRHPVSYFLNEDLSAIPDEHALTLLPRSVTALNLRPEDMTQIMKFAQFLEMSRAADEEADGDERPVPGIWGASS